jgi:hypothetical protein
VEPKGSSAGDGRNSLEGPPQKPPFTRPRSDWMVVLVSDAKYAISRRAAGDRRGREAMPSEWFSTKGQIIQTLSSTISALLSVATIIGVKAGVPNIPPWLAPALIGFFVGSIITLFSRRFAVLSAASNPLELLDLTIFKTADTNIVYKDKLYIIFRNTAAQTFIVGGGTEWVKKDLRVATVLNHEWQVEAGSNSSKEAPTVRVAPGQRLRTWVGVASSVDESEINRVRGRAGTLRTSVVPANIVNIDI